MRPERRSGLTLALGAPVLFVVLVGDQLGLELLHRTASVVDEPAEIAGHLGELAGAEDHQKDQPDDDYLFPADAEHVTNITRRPGGYNVRADDLRTVLTAPERIYSGLW